MIIKIALTEDIINQCLQLHYGDQPAGKKLKQRLLWIPLILIVLGGYLLIDEFQQPRLGSNFIMGILYIAFAISYYFFMKKRVMKAGKRLLKSLGDNANFSIEIKENELVTTTTIQQYTHSWASFTGALIGKQNVLLYQSNDSFTMFNQSFFKPGDFEQFKNLVLTNVKPCVTV